MKKLFTLFSVLYITAASLFGQVLTTIPEVPVATGSVSIIFDASQEPGALNNYTGKLFAHTGVNFKDGSQWQHVIGSWGDNVVQPELQYIDSSTYNLTLSPDLFTYYGASTEKVITQIAIVIRSEDGSKQTQDYLIDIFPEGLQINVIAPSEKTVIIELNDSLEVSVATSNADTIVFYQHGLYATGTTNNTLTHTFIGDTYGENRIVIWAANETEETTDTVYFYVRPEPTVELLPDGMMDGINYLSETSILLSLYAPGKEHIFSIGDFSGWLPMDAYYMKITPDGERFWIRIDNLEPNKLYRFHYLVDGEITIADPYTELLIDPSRDKGISEATYPGIEALYTGLENTHYSVFQTAQSPFSWQVNDFSPPEKEELVIYELLVRDFINAHDWKTLTDTLNYLENLGINAIELMPFNEFQDNESWGYNPTYFFAPDKYYGPGADLKTFIDSCHSRGIAVIQDVVFNHIEWGTPFALLYQDSQGYPSANNPWLNEDFDLNDPKGWYQARHPYSVFFDFNHSSIHTQNFMDRSLRYWADNYKIDGFRFDLTKGFTQKNTYLGTDTEGNAIYNESQTSAYDAQRIGFLKRMADSIWAFKENTYVILEHFCDNTEEKELANYGMMLWGNSNYNYNEATMGYNENGKSDFSWISYKKRGWNDPHVIGYMESHDEERLMYKNMEFGKESGSYSTRDPETALRRMELAGAFFFTIPGPKMIWQFGELGYDFSIDYDCRVCNKPIRWDYFNESGRKRLYQVWSSLIHLKVAEPAFASHDFSLSLSGGGKRIEINHEDMDVRIIGNFDVVDQSLNPSFSRTGWWYDFFTSDSIVVADVNGLISLEPGQFHLYTTKRLEKPDTPVSKREIKAFSDKFSVYPNPVSELLFMDPLNEEATITITDLEGRKVMEKNLGGNQDFIDLTSLAEGLYILSRSTGNSPPSYAKIYKK